MLSGFVWKKREGLVKDVEMWPQGELKPRFGLILLLRSRCGGFFE